MFKDKDDMQSGTLHTATGADTVINEDASFEGKLIFEGNVVVNGRFKGEVISSGTLTVGRTGSIEGTIEIGTINILGEVKGNISAKQKIEINAPSVVRGDIAAPSLIIKEGAVFEGNCSMGATAEIRNSNSTNVVDFQKSAVREDSY